MKKIIYTFLGVLVFACGSDSENNNNNDGNNNNNNPNGSELLVSSISYNDMENSDYEYVENFTYDGNKIVEINRSVYYNGSLNSEDRTEFIYANNKISRVDYYYDNNNNISSQDIFTYDSQGRLVATEYCYNPNDGSCDDSESTTYSYNSDGSTTATYTYGDESETSVIEFDDNGNIVRVSDYDNVSELTYDNYNSPFKNITGATPLVIAQWVFSGSYLYSFKNNCLSFVSESVDEDGVATDVLNFTYDYNDAGYPRNVVVEEVGFVFGQETIVIEYVDWFIWLWKNYSYSPFY